MRPVSESHTEEKETYEQYKDRKEVGWKETVKTLMIEIKDSSLKQDDKDRIQLELIRMLLRHSY